MNNHQKKPPLKPSNLKRHTLATKWEVVDWDGEYFKKKKILIPKGCGGCCTYPKSAPSLRDGTDPPCVKIKSEISLELTTLGFKKNAWKKPGIGQCDAVLFPSTDTEGDAFLLVEIKYSKSENTWQDYKESALKQITDTIGELKKSGCSITKRNLYGLISFPLLPDVGATAFSPLELIEIQKKHHGLQPHVGNTATFKSTKELTFT